MIAMSHQARRYGFTLIEMLIAISIFFIITSVVIFNHGRFNSSINVTNLSYEVALAIRQAQVYGLAVRQDPTTEESDDYAYGVHFSEQSAINGNNKVFYIFADKVNVNQQFDFDPGDACVGGPTEECVERIEIRGDVYVSNLAVNNDANVDELTILFLRPNPLALIFGTGSTNNENSAQIRLTSDRAEKSKLIVVEFSGQISVQDFDQ